MTEPPASWPHVVLVGLVTTVVTAAITAIPGFVVVFLAAAAFDGCGWDCSVRTPSPGVGLAWSALAVLLVVVAPLTSGLVMGWAERTGRRRPQVVVILLVCALPVTYFGMGVLGQLA